MPDFGKPSKAPTSNWGGWVYVQEYIQDIGIYPGTGAEGPKRRKITSWGKFLPVPLYSVRLLAPNPHANDLALRSFSSCTWFSARISRHFPCDQAEFKVEHLLGGPASKHHPPSSHRFCGHSCQTPNPSELIVNPPKFNY